jgi:hypothetical protein
LSETRKNEAIIHRYNVFYFALLLEMTGNNMTDNEEPVKEVPMTPSI